MQSVVLIAHNLRSCHNVGSLLRTADGLGLSQVILSGYTPYPQMSNDPRLPHEARKIHTQIHKTALGAEETVPWQQVKDISLVLQQLKRDEYQVMALEQTAEAKPLPGFRPPKNIALVVGREVEGIEAEVLDLCDGSLEIPMHGQKESFNVASAAAMALYHVTFCYTYSQA